MYIHTHMYIMVDSLPPSSGPFTESAWPPAFS